MNSKTINSAFRLTPKHFARPGKVLTAKAWNELVRVTIELKEDTRR